MTIFKKNLQLQIEKKIFSKLLGAPAPDLWKLTQSTQKTSQWARVSYWMPAPPPSGPRSTLYNHSEQLDWYRFTRKQLAWRLDVATPHDSPHLPNPRARHRTHIYSNGLTIAWKIAKNSSKLRDTYLLLYIIQVSTFKVNRVFFTLTPWPFERKPKSSKDVIFDQRLIIPKIIHDQRALWVSATPLPPPTNHLWEKQATRRRIVTRVRLLIVCFSMLSRRSLTSKQSCSRYRKECIETL